MIRDLLKLVKGKRVFIATHWDADGITSGAMLYHSIKHHAKTIRTLSKGKVFRIDGADIPKDADIVMCTDVQPADTITQPVIYFDHHPYDNNGLKGLAQHFALKAYDTSYQSSSHLVWDKVLEQPEEPYLAFLALLGFFGDAGKNTEIPPELEACALKSFPELMEPLVWPDGKMCLVIEKYVSFINLGKRMHWQGTVPFELLKSIESYEQFVNQGHPLFRELEQYKKELRQLYAMDVTIKHYDAVDCIMIECPRNIQGVLCARHMDGKPILVLNKYDDEHVMGSLRVPDSVAFNAGEFLQRFMGKIDGILGGGHEKAGGISLPTSEFARFLALLKEEARQIPTKATSRSKPQPPSEVITDRVN